MGFVCRDDEWNEERTTRRIKALSLHRGDVSLGSMAANEKATVVSLRQRDGATSPQPPIAGPSFGDQVGRVRAVREKQDRRVRALRRG
jgi:hypothetical protein